MGKDWLEMEYHPAMKEIEFRRGSGTGTTRVDKKSCLAKYMLEQKGKFILQDHGNDFFDDVKKAFDGLSEVEIKVVTTKLDYMDFEQMAEYYNEGSDKFKITTTLLAELPSMKAAFKDVMDFGKNTVDALNAKKTIVFDVPTKNGTVKERAQSLASFLSEEVRSIRNKMDNLESSNVNICFAGVYSSGKSSLINALLGYKILPASPEAKTAKMLVIMSPEKGKPVEITFFLVDTYSRIEWNDHTSCFEFSKGPVESQERTEIQNKMNEVKGKKRHEQLYAILDTLNEVPGVSETLHLKFPIEIDSDLVKFTIYDTPGTDSNSEGHKEVLSKALGGQSQSILIFVCRPNALEGSGTNALLTYIKDAEQKNDKNTIDIARSFVVMTHADDVNRDERKGLRDATLTMKEDPNFSLHLREKKLLFVSSKFAAAAKACMKEETKTRDDEFWIKKNPVDDEMSPNGLCYRENRMASSDLATRRMIEKSDAAAQDAREKWDDNRLVYVTSGLYALEEELKDYGEKFASAVRASAIIQGVEKTLANVTAKSQFLCTATDQNIVELEEEIRQLKERVDAIVTEAGKKANANMLSQNDLHELGLASTDIEKSKGQIAAEVDFILGKPGIFSGGKIKLRPEHEQDITSVIDDEFSRMNYHFTKASKKVLEGKIEAFLTNVFNSIQSDTSISDNAKKTLMKQVSAVESVEFGPIPVTQIMKEHKVTKMVWFKKKDYLKKEDFLSELKESLSESLAKWTDAYIAAYKKKHKEIVERLKDEFRGRVEEYSSDTKAKIEDKDAMTQLGEKLKEVAASVKALLEELEKKIWQRSVKNG